MKITVRKKEQTRGFQLPRDITIKLNFVELTRLRIALTQLKVAKDGYDELYEVVRQAFEERMAYLAACNAYDDYMSAMTEIPD